MVVFVTMGTCCVFVLMFYQLNLKTIQFIFVFPSSNIAYTNKHTESHVEAHTFNLLSIDQHTQTAKTKT